MPQWFKRQPNGALSKKALVGIGGGLFILLAIIAGGGGEPEATQVAPTQNETTPIVEDAGDVLGDVIEETVIEEVPVEAAVVEKAPAPIKEPTPAPVVTQSQPEPEPYVAPTPTPEPELVVTEPTPVPTSKYSCSIKKTCGDMVSCEEAYFYLNTCGDTERDGDDDGVPCEKICN